MMITVARRFEGLQGSFPFSLASDSGFSGEDLVSDLLGFYQVRSCMNNVFSYLKPISKKEALKRWDHYGKIGSWKNEAFKPLLFPDPVRSPNGRPHFGQLPDFMKSVTLYNRWTSEDVGIVDPKMSVLLTLIGVLSVLTGDNHGYEKVTKNYAGRSDNMCNGSFLWFAISQHGVL